MSNDDPILLPIAEIPIEYVHFAPLPNERRVSIFAVVQDGSLVAEQENRPQINAPAAAGESCTWNVVDVAELTGQPTFWMSTSGSDSSTQAKLNWAGIDPKDWELGRVGRVTIECTGDSGTETIVVRVEVRSIGIRDLTFFTPANSFVLEPNARSTWGGSYDYTLKPPLGSDKVVDFGVQKRPSPSSDIGVELYLDPDNRDLFNRARDSWVELRISGQGDAARFRLRLAIRPLTVAGGSYPCEAELELVRGQTLQLEIDGDPSVPNGYSWTLEGFNVGRFKGAPSFASIGNTASARLDLRDLTDWDWINGTTGGMVDLVVRDGLRPAARMPLRFHLEPSQQRFSLEAGTLLEGPDGVLLEVAEDGVYLPVGMTGEPDAQIVLENLPVRAQEAGADANLPAGTVLSFVEAQPLLASATVGVDGLTLGASEESSDRLRDRIRVLWADPPAHGNRSHVLQIAWQTAGVDKAFVYPPFALNGLDGLGRVGIGLVAPGTRAGVSRRSALADEVRARLTELGSFTADYVIMDVDDRGPVDPLGKGACQVDLEIQVRLNDETSWKWPSPHNIVVENVDGTALRVFTDPNDIAQERAVLETLSGLVQGDSLQVLGLDATVSEVNAREYLVYLAEPILDEHGQPVPAEQLVGARIYPTCPLKSEIEPAIRGVFAALGTSEAPLPVDESSPPGLRPDPKLPWQRRYPQTTFLYPDVLRLAEIVNQLYETKGLADLRIVSPKENVAPPTNAANTTPAGEQVFTTYILTLRRLMLGPYRPTPGEDLGLSAPGNP